MNIDHAAREIPSTGNRLGREQKRIPSPPPPKQDWGLGWPVWQLWAFLLVLVAGGMGFGAMVWLFKLPKVPNCEEVSWRFASASMRMYCAQLEAEKKTASGLLWAIALIEELPLDHPLRPQINANVEEWATDLLNVAERNFQAGQLEKAISMAEKIPIKSEAHRLVAERMERWRSIWSKGEESYNEAERQLRAGNWLLAFRFTVKLSYVKNNYWATIKYQELIDKIQLARNESGQLDKAHAALRRGGFQNIIKAIKEAEGISQDSYAYQEAQNIIANGQKKIIQIAENLIKRQNWSQLSRIINDIPPNLELQDQLNDWDLLARAGSNAQLGTMNSLEIAILQAQTILPSSAIYEQVQPLLKRWELEMAGVILLSEAEKLARVGSIASLTSAIAKLQEMPSNNPRYQEARSKINDWQRNIAILEDKPFLDRAQEWAYSGTVNGLQEAINQASLIDPNRPLYREAQNKIRRWRKTIQRQQDQPILDRAMAFANVGNFAAAIETAGEIKPGRVLYNDAQAKIIDWQRELTAREILEKAYRISRQGTPDALAKAIEIAYTIPSSTSVGTRQTQLLNSWSEQLLLEARSEARYSLKRAIAIAQKVPYGTSTYNQARADIKAWQEQLQPRLYLPEPTSQQ